MIDRHRLALGEGRVPGRSINASAGACQQLVIRAAKRLPHGRLQLRQFWEQHGGLAVFGFPITSELVEAGRTVQYFERQRFELHEESARPYDVLLGRLGAEALQQRGIDWATQPIVPGPVAGCMYFAQTRHTICDQQPGVGFLTEWTTHGLEFDGRRGKSYAENLALFGLPITEPYQYTNEQGQTVQAQWFERARFEWHPDNPSPYKVLLGRLGAELHPTAPPAQPAYDKPNSPADLLASFYDAVNHQEYQRAYGYWETPPSSYDDFVRGYADTVSVQLIVEPPVVWDTVNDRFFARVPMVLIATNRDGSQHLFAGCYVESSPRQAAGWSIFPTTTKIAPAPSNVAVPTLLNRQC